MTVSITGSGSLVDLLAPAQAEIRVSDIAIQLAVTARFTGATVRLGGGPYYVAQHSCVVARLVSQAHARNPLLQLQALLHDAHEAFTGDITTPLKQALGPAAAQALQRLQDGLDAAIHAALGVALPSETHASLIARADAIALATEWRDLMPGPCPIAAPPANFAIRPLPWDRAEDLFLRTFDRLSIAAGILMPGPFTPTPTGIIK